MGFFFVSTEYVQDGNVSTYRARISSVGEVSPIAQGRQEGGLEVLHTQLLN